ncbi:hypothetical protein [Deinococcus sp. Leaf326]|uniref:hypothetical protein n=1 Tax=Deinococcus sp. Leaf326 TaxID=1736338 RepID=UPI000A84F891|nr:hypothetical protein [Deinococcus sp. Leaf326]
MTANPLRRALRDPWVWWFAQAREHVYDDMVYFVSREQALDDWRADDRKWNLVQVRRRTMIRRATRHNRVVEEMVRAITRQKAMKE